MTAPCFAERAAPLYLVGDRVFPVGHDKRPLIAAWPTAATDDTDQIEKWSSQFPSARIGMPTDNYVVLDIDRKPGADGVATLKARGYALPKTFGYKTQSGGLHLYFKKPDGMHPRSSAGKLGPGLDIRAEGGYVIRHDLEGQPSANEGMLADPPQWLVDFLTGGPLPAVVSVPSGLVNNSDLSSGMHPEMPIEEIKARLAVLGADCPRDQWRNLGMAVHAATGGSDEGYGAWDAWSATAADKYPGEPETRKQWDSFRGDGIGPGTLVYMSNEAGYVRPSVEPAANPQATHVAQPSTAAKPITSVTLTSALDVRMEPITWLWPEWLARGKLTILAGQAGTGKTTLALGLAATVTTGGRWPDGVEFKQPGNVLVWSGEDDPADTLKPRLLACGADPARLFFVTAIRDEKGNTAPFDPARDVPELAQAIRNIGGASLLIVDPIVSAVGGDMHKASDVRRSLQPLVNLAMQEGCAVLGITHFSKGSVGSSPQDRVIGSQAFGALARTVLVAAKQEGDEARILARAKSNISIDTGGVAYTVQGATLTGGISTTRVEWGGVIEGTARDLLGAVEQQPGGDAPDGEPVDALRHVLQDGRVEAGRAKRALNSSGFSEKQIRTAREKLNVVSEREGFGSDMKTFWKLPNTP